MPVYVVDANFFIQAHRVIYPMDVFISFWNKLRELAASGEIESIDKVKVEIYNNNDALKKWCQANLPKDFFKSTEQSVHAYRRVSQWADSRKDHYLPKALSEFLDADDADAFLVAYVLNDRSKKVLVTYETSEPNRRSKVKIPDCCIALGVNYTSTIHMFRDLKETF